MRLAFAVAPVAMMAIASCGDAAGTVQGGGPLFAPPVDCTPTASACGTWTHMYGCYFGPQAPSGGCAGSGGSCHATAAGAGVSASGFICGPTAGSCWQGMMSATPPLVVATSKSDIGLQADLYKAGSTPGPRSNNMPTTGLNGAPFMSMNWKGFTPSDMNCISDWVNAGAPND
jgi:hypothetical protein